MSTFDPREMLRVLVRHEVRFIVVGGLAGVLRGAEFITHDLDVVPRLNDENIERLQSALRALDARFRARPDLEPQRSHLMSRGHKLLTTRAGSVDVLGTIGNDEDYDTLIVDADRFQVGDIEFDVLGLDSLIRTKRAAGRDKDLLMIPHLERLAQLVDEGEGD